MRDKKLRREAMVKRYALQQLLENAANKEYIGRQALDMEGNSQQMKSKLKEFSRRGPGNLRTNTNTSRRRRAQIKMSCVWKNLWRMLQKRPFARMSKGEKNQKELRRKPQSTAKSVQQGNRRARQSANTCLTLETVPLLKFELVG